MKNILLIIVGIVLGAGAYQLFMNDNNLENNPAENQNEVSNESTPSEESASIDEVEEELTVDSSDETSELVTSTACQDLKDAVPGSAAYVIMTGLAGGSTITNGDTLSGCIYAPNGSYAGWGPFEGQVGSYTVKADDGTILGTGPLPVVPLDWQTPAIANEDIEYSTTMNFDSTGYTSGTVTLNNENPSGEAINDKSIDITVNF